MNVEDRPYSIVNREITSIGRIKVIKDTICIKDKEYPYTFVDIKPSVCIIATYNGQVVMIKQYRHALNEWVLEFPCGCIDSNESMEMAAKRELFEETGYIAEDLIYLGAYHSSPGISNGVCHIFYATCKNNITACPEETEYIEVKLIDINAMDKLIYEDKFKLLIGIVGWMKAKERKLIQEELN